MELFALRKLSLAAAITLASLCFHPGSAEAGGGVTQQMSAEATAEADPGTGKFESLPFKVSVSVRGGYDDNVNLDDFDSQESFVTSASLGVTYDSAARARRSV